MYHEIIRSSMLHRKLGHSVATASGYYLPPETSPLVDPVPERCHSQPLNVRNLNGAQMVFCCAAIQVQDS